MGPSWSPQSLLAFIPKYSNVILQAPILNFGIIPFSYVSQNNSCSSRKSSKLWKANQRQSRLWIVDWKHSQTIYIFFKCMCQGIRSNVLFSRWRVETNPDINMNDVHNVLLTEVWLVALQTACSLCKMVCHREPCWELSSKEWLTAVLGPGCL